MYSMDRGGEMWNCMERLRAVVTFPGFPHGGRGSGILLLDSIGGLLCFGLRKLDRSNIFSLSSRLSSVCVLLLTVLVRLYMPIDSSRVISVSFACCLS